MNDWMLWQLADSAFPAGGFAHSAGLEAAWQCGEVTDTASLVQFVRDSVLQAGHAALPLVTAAYRAPDRLDALDALCDAFLSTTVANRASRVQGRAFLSACARTWPTPALGALADRAAGLHGHLGPIFGTATSALDCPLASTQRLFLFLTARTVLSAAVRLGLTGPYHAQQLLAACTPDVDRVLDRCADLTDDDLAQAAPLIDVVQGSHDRLYSRLFQS